MDYTVIRYRITEEQMYFLLFFEPLPIQKVNIHLDLEGTVRSPGVYIIRVRITTLHCFVTQLNILQEYYLNNMRLNKRQTVNIQ